VHSITYLPDFFGINIHHKKMRSKILCGLPLKAGLKKVADPVLAEEMVSLKYRVRLQSATLYVRKMNKTEDTRGYLAICLNEKEKQAIRERRYDVRYFKGDKPTPIEKVWCIKSG
jgi:hypothetical protein